MEVSDAEPTTPSWDKVRSKLLDGSPKHKQIPGRTKSMGEFLKAGTGKSKIDLTETATIAAQELKSLEKVAARYLQDDKDPDAPTFSTFLQRRSSIRLPGRSISRLGALGGGETAAGEGFMGFGGLGTVHEQQPIVEKSLEEMEAEAEAAAKFYEEKERLAAERKAKIPDRSVSRKMSVSIADAAGMFLAEKSKWGMVKAKFLEEVSEKKQEEDGAEEQKKKFTFLKRGARREEQQEASRRQQQAAEEKKEEKAEKDLYKDKKYSMTASRFLQAFRKIKEERAGKPFLQALSKKQGGVRQYMSFNK